MDTAPALTWLFDAERDRYAAGLPGGTDEPRLPVRGILQRLRPAANDTFTDLLIVGWAQGALEVVMADPVLREKQITWIMRAGHLAAFAAAGARPANCRVAVCDDHAQLPYILEFLPICSSLAVLEDALCPASELTLLGRTRFQRSRGSLHRAVGDLLHLVHRLPVLPEAIPLSAWKDGWKGRSALCLAAGPSLDRHMDFIRAHMDRCVVIVVDVLQQKLQERGIRIDFILTVDSDDRLNQRLVAPTDPSTVMVMPVLGHRGLDAKFPRRSYFGHGMFARWLLGPDPIFQTGTTVGIASVGFARFLGCDEAVLLGHDLSFSEDAYYSDLVAGKDQHQAEMSAESNMMKRHVPGNSGGTVTTDYLFEVGIQDLGMMLRALDGFTAYNMNINTASAARIAGTQAVPDGWTPRGEGPSPRPQATARLADDIAKDLTTLVPEKIVGQVESARARWDQLRGEGCNALQIEAELAAHPWTTMGMGYLSLVYQGPLLLQMRLLSLPPSISTEWHRRETESFIAGVVARGEEFMRRVFTNDPPDVGHELHHIAYPEGAAKFFHLLAASLPEAGAVPAETILLPPACRALRDMRQAFPEIGFPPPQSAFSALVVARACGDTTPSDFLEQTLCLCALEDLQEPLGFARETAVLPAHRQPGGDAQGRRRRGEAPWLDATDAVLRLRAGTSASTRADARAACAWPPCQLHAVRALLGRGDAGVDALEQLLDRRDLDPDDQQISMILLHVPDFRRACTMIGPFTRRLGEASQVAMAARRQQAGELEPALKLALGIRRASRFRDSAIDIACRCLAALGRHGEITALLDDAEDEDLVDHWRQDRPWRAVLDEIESGTRLPAADVCATLVAGAWEARDRSALERLFILLYRRGRDGDDAAARKAFTELYQAVQVLLRRLGADIPALVASAADAAGKPDAAQPLQDAGDQQPGR